MSIKKYRPYFTLPELKVLRDSLKSFNSSSPSLPLIRYLDKYISDIEAGLRVENHTLVPSISQKLGLDSPTVDTSTRDNTTLLDIYIANNRSFIGMTPAEIESLQQYRFEVGHMSPQEEETFVESLMKG